MRPTSFGDTGRCLLAALALGHSTVSACGFCRPQVFEALRADPALPALLVRLGTVPVLVAALAAFSLWLSSRRAPSEPADRHPDIAKHP